MTRSEAIAIIDAVLPALNTEQVAALAEAAKSLARGPATLQITDEDRAGIDRARQDFESGRTYSSAEARAMTATSLTKLRGSMARP